MYSNAKIENFQKSKIKMLTKQLENTEKEKNRLEKELRMLLSRRVTPEPDLNDRFNRLLNKLKHGVNAFHDDYRDTVIDALEAARNESMTLDELAIVTSRMLKARDYLKDAQNYKNLLQPSPVANLIQKAISELTG